MKNLLIIAILLTNLSCTSDFKPEFVNLDILYNYNNPIKYIDSMIIIYDKNDYLNTLATYFCYENRNCELSNFYIKDYLFNDSTYYYISQGFVNLCNKDYLSAKWYFDRSSLLDVSNKNIWTLYGQSLLQKELHNDFLAIELLNKCRHISPENPFIIDDLFDLCLLHYDISIFNILSELMSYINTRYDKDYINFRRGQYYLYLLKFSKKKDKNDYRLFAKESFKKCIEYNNKYLSSYIHLASILIDEKKTIEALNTINEAKKHFPNNTELLGLECEVYGIMEEYEKAEKIIDSVLVLDPNQMNNLARAIYIKLLLNKFDESRKLINSFVYSNGFRFDIELYQIIWFIKQGKSYEQRIEKFFLKYPNFDEYKEFLVKVLKENRIEESAFFKYK